GPGPLGDAAARAQAPPVGDLEIEIEREQERLEGLRAGNREAAQEERALAVEGVEQIVLRRAQPGDEVLRGVEPGLRRGAEDARLEVRGLQELGAAKGACGERPAHRAPPAQPGRPGGSAAGRGAVSGPFLVSRSLRQARLTQAIRVPM